MKEKFKVISELSTLLNKFNSEAAQLRILDKILPELFGSETVVEQKDSGKPGKKSGRKKPNLKKGKSSPDVTKKKVGTKGQKGRPGQKELLMILVADGYFDKPRTSKEVVDHIKHNLAHTFTVSELTSTFARLTRDKVLSRARNESGQYKYTRT
ncbi:MAG: hypothetical protein OEZ32_09595 [Nitrospinota bacterium]|nr:hypothetical protein [Nitrospinota bacterium]